jgi:pimeloyl-ACP methyl ester carboxylesterase
MLVSAFPLIAGAALAGCHEEVDAEASPPHIEWTDCSNSLATLECGWLTAPVSYDDPRGPVFEIPVVRAPALDPERRIGALIMNPGGPGGSGVDLVKVAPLVMPQILKERFDLVGFDPRGQAASKPSIDCGDDIAAFLALDTTPDTDAERAALVDQSRALAAGCEERSGEILPFVGTDHVVRDMDRLREALGDEKLTYLGFSYGTFLGAIYADTFPDRVRALVLDAAVDPGLTLEEMTLGQSLGHERALETFFDWCAADAACRYFKGKQPLDPAAVYDAVQAAVEAAPLPAAGHTLGPGEFALGVASALHQPAWWKELGDALADARMGDGSALLAFSDGYRDGPSSNAIEAQYAVKSIDFASAHDPEAYAALAVEAQQKAPRIGAYLPYLSLPSAFWPVDPWRPAGHVSAAGAPAILVIGATRDPATPLEWAKSLASQLSRGVLLTREGDGHTSFLRGYPCIDQAVADYLVNLAPPPPGMVCIPQ